MTYYTGIYVDHLTPTIRSASWPYDRGCHLFHYEHNVPLLDRFAELIGLRWSWRHNAPCFPHYDLTEKMRARAVAEGATEIDWRSEVGRAVMLRRRECLAARARK